MVTCPMCGFAFEELDTLCHHGCPLSACCDLVRCPSCEYELPRSEPTGRPTFWQRLFSRGPRPGSARASGVASVRQLSVGPRARVLAVAGADDRRRTTLAVFGLAPGSEIELVQRHPAYVVHVDETDLALDAEIASEILVEAVEPVEVLS